MSSSTISLSNSSSTVSTYSFSFFIRLAGFRGLVKVDFFSSFIFTSSFRGLVKVDFFTRSIFISSFRGVRGSLLSPPNTDSFKAFIAFLKVYCYVTVVSFLPALARACYYIFAVSLRFRIPASVFSFNVPLFLFIIAYTTT